MTGCSDESSGPDRGAGHGQVLDSRQDAAPAQDGTVKDISGTEKGAPDEAVTDSKPSAPDSATPPCKTTGVCSPSGFCSEGLVNADVFNGVWVAANGEAFAVGAGGAVVHLSGGK